MSAPSISAAEYKALDTKKRGKYQQPERLLHQSIAQFFDWALPADAFWFAIPNSANFDFRRAATLKKYREITAGMTDIGLVYRGRFIAIELKAGKNDTTDNQDSAHRLLTLAGALVIVTRSVTELAGQLDCIMTLRGRPQ